MIRVFFCAEKVRRKRKEQQLRSRFTAFFFFGIGRRRQKSGLKARGRSEADSPRALSYLFRRAARMRVVKRNEKSKPIKGIEGSVMFGNGKKLIGGLALAMVLSLTAGAAISLSGAANAAGAGETSGAGVPHAAPCSASEIMPTVFPAGSEYKHNARTHDGWEVLKIAFNPIEGGGEGVHFVEPETDGKYYIDKYGEYLPDNVTYYYPDNTVSADFILCLNGHTLKLDETLYITGNVHICDCVGGEGITCDIVVKDGSLELEGIKAKSVTVDGGTLTVSGDTTIENVTLIGDNSIIECGELTDGASIIIEASEDRKGPYVHAENDDDLNYFHMSDESDPAAIKIGVTFDFPEDITYNGEDWLDDMKGRVKVTNLSTEEDLTYDDDYTIQVSGETLSGTTEMINAGTYAVKVTLTEGKHYELDEGSTDEAEYTISPHTVKVNVSDNSKTYNGEEQEPTVTVTGVPGYFTESDYTITYSTDDGQMDSDKPKGAGTYAIHINFQGEAAINYALPEKIDTFKIKEKEITVQFPKELNATYSGSDWLNTLKNGEYISFEGTVAEETIRADDYVLTITAGPDTTSMTKEGTYTVKVSLSDTSATAHNYKLTVEPTHEYTIKKADLTVRVGDPVTYNGKEQTPVTVTGISGPLTEGGSSDYTVTYLTSDGQLSGGKPQGAGTYGISITLHGDADINYNTPTVRETFQIKKATLTVQLSESKTTYDGKNHARDILDAVKSSIGSNAPHPEEGEYTVTIDGEADTEVKNVKKGGYQVKVELNENAQKNFVFEGGAAFTTLTYTANKAANEWTGGSGTEVTLAGWTYGTIEGTWAAAKDADTATVTLVQETSAASLTVEEGEVLTLNLNGKTLTADIGISGGSFLWGGGDITTIHLKNGAFITVQEDFAAPTEKIAVRVDEFTDVGTKVHSWASGDPAAHFVSADKNACYYTKEGENAAYIGKHSLVKDDREPSWSGYASAEIYLRCEHTGCEKTASGAGGVSERKSGETCTKESDTTYTATVTLTELTAKDPSLTEGYATLKGGSVSAETVKAGEKKSAPTHEWTYRAGADGKSLKAECTNPLHNDEEDGERSFSVTFTAPEGATYSGEAQPAKAGGATGADPFKGGFSFAYRYRKSGTEEYGPLVGDAPANAGEYQVTVTANDDRGAPQAAASLTFEIGKAKIASEIEWETLGSYPYKNDTYELPGAKATGVGGAKLTLRVGMTHNPDGEGEAVFRNAGVYTFTASLEEGDAVNYEFDEGIEASKNITIDKATVVKPAGDTKEFTYNGEDQTYEVRGGTEHFRLDGNTEKEANESGYTVTLNDPANYRWAGEEESSEPLEFTFRIARAPLTVTWSGGEVRYTYTYGEAVDPSVELQGKFGSDDGSVIVATGDGAFRNAGEYTYTATLEGGAKENYFIKTGETQAYTIEKASLTAQLSATVVYGDELELDGVTVTISAGFQYDDEAQRAQLESGAKAGVGGIGNFVTIYGKGTTHVGGIATISYASAVELENYEVTFTAGNVTVTQREITLKLGSGSNTYGDEAHGAITADAERGGAGAWFGSPADETLLEENLEFTFRKNGAGEAQAYTQKMAAGSYTVTAKWKEESPLATDYKIVNEDTGATYTVGRKELTVTMKATVEYGEEVSANNVELLSASGLVPGDVQADILDQAKERAVFSFGGYTTNTGVCLTNTVSVTAENQELENYIVRYTPCTLQITAREIKVKLTFHSKAYGDPH